MRSRFYTQNRYIMHFGQDPFTGDPFKRIYWLPIQGGYVRLDTTPDESRPGTLGGQPTYSDGSTWWAADLAQLAKIIRSEWRKEKLRAKVA